jgi:hypothetical protein
MVSAEQGNRRPGRDAQLRAGGAWLVAALVLGAIARDMLGGPASPQP